MPSFSGVQANWYIYSTYRVVVLCIKLYVESRRNLCVEKGQSFRPSVCTAVSC